MINTVFFDWGGVIADDPGDDFLGKLLKEVGANDSQVRDIFETYMSAFMRGKITEDEYWQRLRDEYGFQISSNMSKKFMKWNGLTANGDVVQFVETLRARKYKVAVLSNVIEPTFNAIKSTGYYDMFDEVIASCKVGFAKPDSEIYDIALEKTKSIASESLFIDDKERCLVPARQMGMTTIQAVSSGQIIDDVEAILRLHG